MTGSKKNSRRKSDSERNLDLSRKPEKLEGVLWIMMPS
jgi:hypothetical protein